MLSSINEIPRSETVKNISGEFVFFKMRENSGVDLFDSANKGVFVDDTVSLAAAGAGQWANEGWITPDGTNHTVLIPDSNDGLTKSGIATMLESADIYGSGGFLIMFDYWGQAAPVGSHEYLFSWHPGNNLAGGFALRVATAGYLQLQWNVPGGSSTYNAIAPLSALINAGAGQRNSIVVYIDMSEALSDPSLITCYSYYNNIVFPLFNVTVGSPVADLISVYQGFSLFADNNNVGVNKLLNGAATPSNSRLNNLFIKKCTTDIKGDLSAIAKEHFDNPYDLPRRLLKIS